MGKSDRFDGSGRDPWPWQNQVLDWFQDNWSNSNILALSLPCGTGKQAIARALQLEYGGAYITPSNMLIDQAAATYKDVNILKGVAHYKCEQFDDLSCQERKEIGEHHCKGCHYVKARTQALLGKDTFYNPMSYFYLSQSKKFEKPPVIVFDEAHKLGDMLRAVGSEEFSGKVYSLPKACDLITVMEWLESLENRMGKALDGKSLDSAKVRMMHIRQQKIRRILDLIRTEGENYLAHIKPHLDTEALVIEPIYPPVKYLKALSAHKMVFMSATLLRSDVEELVGRRPYLYYDQDSPIPAKDRQVLYRPAPTDFNFKTDPQDVANWIKSQLQPGLNTIIHVTYGWSKKLQPLLPGLMFNTPETKIETLNKFKANGGVWLASGCSEGIDLPGDQCRLNIIPILPRPNIMDPIVKKRTAKDGNRWYDMETLKTLIQQIGRSTRGVGDSSTSIVGDRQFGKLVGRWIKELPKGFLSSIKWER